MAESRGIRQRELARQLLRKARQDLILVEKVTDDAGAEPPSTLDAVEALGTFAVQFRYALYTDLDIDRKTSIALAREFIDWAHAVIETPA